jgi:hypothetical protein
MSKRTAPPMQFKENPVIAAERRKKAKAGEEPAPDTEMLSARVNGTNARQFRAYAKMKGETVQLHLDRAIAEYMERHRF